MAEKKADLIFKYYRIGNSKIELDIKAQKIEGETEISIANEIRRIGDNEFEIELNTTVVNESKTMNIQVSMTGYFEVLPILDENKKAALINLNAPAIMFPYIRAYISSLTGLSGLAPVIIPAINMTQRDDA